MVQRACYKQIVCYGIDIVHRTGLETERAMRVWQEMWAGEKVHKDS